MRRHKAQPVPQNGSCLLFLWVNQPPASPPGTPAIAKLRPCLGKQMRQQLGFSGFQGSRDFTTPGKQRQLHITRFRYRHNECDIAQECLFAAALGNQLSHNHPTKAHSTMKTVAYSHPTRRGIFWIAIQHDMRWHIVFEGDSLDGYDDPHTAAYELANGLTMWPSFGDPTTLGIPEELSDWTPHSSP